MALELGLALALGSAVATNLGFLLRHRGAVAAPDVDMRHPLRSAIDLFRSKWWTIGYAVAILAYLLHVGALALAPMSLVQAVLAGGLVLLGVIAERMFGFHLGKREWAGVLLASAGLTFLAVTGGGAESGEESSRYSIAAMVGFEAALVGLGTLLILLGRSHESDHRSALLLGAAAGALFSVAHVAVKALSDKTDSGLLAVLTSPFLLVALLAWAVAFFSSARSLQIGEAVAVIAVTSIAGNVTSIPAGIIVFGDPLGSDALSVVLRSAAFVLVIAAAALIPAPTRASGARSSATDSAASMSPTSQPASTSVG